MSAQPASCPEIIECRTAKEFIDLLQPTNDRWQRSKIDSEWLFRGQADATWTLLPAAWRTLSNGRTPSAERLRSRIRSSPQFEAILSGYGDLNLPPFGLEPQNREKWRQMDPVARRKRFRDYVEQFLSEVIPAADFWRIADDVGHPITPPDWIKQKWMTSGLLMHGVGDGGESFWEHPLTAMLQHHGVPTRFLDWTLNPLIAAYFAAEGSQDTQGHMAVWALKRDGLKVARSAGLLEYHVPRHLLPFLHAQSGCFVWNTYPTAHFAMNGEWPSQEEVLAQVEAGFRGTKPSTPWLLKIVVPKSEAGEILSLLWRSRISRAHLMPTFDNVAVEYWRAAEWQNTEAWFD